MNEEIRQLAALEEQETHIHLDYQEKEIVIYSNRAYTIKKMIDRGHVPVELHRYNGEIGAAEWRFPFHQMRDFLRVGMFGVGSGKKQEFQEIRESDGEDINEPSAS